MKVLSKVRSAGIPLALSFLLVACHSTTKESLRQQSSNVASSAESSGSAPDAQEVMGLYYSQTLVMGAGSTTWDGYNTLTLNLAYPDYGFPTITASPSCGPITGVWQQTFGSWKNPYVFYAMVHSGTGGAYCTINVSSTTLSYGVKFPVNYTASVSIPAIELAPSLTAVSASTFSSDLVLQISGQRLQGPGPNYPEPLSESCKVHCTSSSNPAGRDLKGACNSEGQTTFLYFLTPFAGVFTPTENVLNCTLTETVRSDSGSFNQSGSFTFPLAAGSFQPQILSFSADDASVNQGAQTILRWSTVGFSSGSLWASAPSSFLIHDLSAQEIASGGYAVSPSTGTSYTLMLYTGAGAEADATTHVDVSLPTCALALNGQSSRYIYGYVGELTAWTVSSTGIGPDVSYHWYGTRDGVPDMTGQVYNDPSIFNGPFRSGAGNHSFTRSIQITDNSTGQVLCDTAAGSGPLNVYIAP